MSMVGCWISGSWAETEIEGFIVEETYGSVEFIIKKFNRKAGISPLIKHGSVHRIAKRIVEKDFVCLNEEQQKSAVMLAQQIGQHEWSMQLVRKYNNPFLEKGY